MAVVLGTNAGFLTVAPVADPAGGNNIDGFNLRHWATKDTSPATAVKVTEIGFYIDNATGNSTFDVGIYTNGAGKPNALLGGVSRNNPKGVDAGWKRVTGLNITISQNTIYWIAMQGDNVPGAAATNINYDAEAGADSSLAIGGTELQPTWNEIVGFANSVVAIYAIWETTPPPSPPPMTGGRELKHNWKKYPELSNSQMMEFAWQTPHKQITEDFRAEVIKVTDGDTIRLRTTFRDFDFPMRFLDMDAPEMNAGGEEAKEWLTTRILGKTVDIRINRRNRVDKYGRLLGRVFANGLDVGDEMLRRGLVKPFSARHEGKIPYIHEVFNIKRWL